MRILLFLISVSSLAFAGNSKPFQNHDEAERDRHHWTENLAFGDRESFRWSERRYAWPVTVLSIGHTSASYQQYLFSEPYFHHGLDIRADAGSEVRAAAGGQVVNIENYMPPDSAYWEVAILDNDGFLWQYHHIEPSSIPEGIFAAYKNHTPIAAGTKLGEVFEWPISTFGEIYHHVHLNILGKDKTYLTPFDFLEHLNDKQAPQIVNIGIDSNGKTLSKAPSSGNYTLFAEIHDLILHQKFVVPPHEVIVSIDDGMPTLVWRFDELPGKDSNTKFVEDFFLPSRSCGNYECRRPVINLAFGVDSSLKMPITPGSHTVAVIATDYEGNSTRREFMFEVK